MNKLINCGCGGEPEIFWMSSELVCLGCKECGIRLMRDTIAEAITAWNKAMGKRIAVVKDFGHPCGTYGYCSNCGGYCVNEDPYCPHCGAKVEWK